jgi:hypoxanthine phosphoribosyltransferase
LQHLLGGELIGIHARRPENRIKKIGSNLYSMIPRVFREILRKIDLKVSKNNLEREVILDSSVDFKQQESILIVDDSLDTGSTLTSVKDALVDRGANPKRIKIVVINTTLDTSIIKPDFVYKRNVIFGYPWSQDSKEHSKFLKLYKNYQRNLLTPENLWSYLINNF